MRQRLSDEDFQLGGKVAGRAERKRALPTDAGRNVELTGMAPWNEDEPTFPAGGHRVATLHLDDLDDAELDDLDLPVPHPASPLASGRNLHPCPPRPYEPPGPKVTSPGGLDGMLSGYPLVFAPPPQQPPALTEDLEREATRPERPRRR